MVALIRFNNLIGMICNFSFLLSCYSKNIVFKKIGLEILFLKIVFCNFTLIVKLKKKEKETSLIFFW